MASDYTYSVAPKAQADMDSIFAYISVSLQNITAAFKQMDDFEAAFERACTQPESCPTITNEYVRDGTLRKLVVNNYIAFYKIVKERKELVIVRVLYGMRNYAEIL